MTNEQKQVKDWMLAFGQECPEKPIIPSLEVRKLRAKLILEEAIETIEKGLGIDVFIGQGRRDCRLTGISTLDFVENIYKPNLLEIADGCEDLKVVTEGTLVACGLTNTRLHRDMEGFERDCDKDYDPLFDEVMKSNWSKFWTRDELQIEFNGLLPAMKDDKPIWLEPYWVSIVPIKAAFQEKCYLVKDKDGKVVKSPSYTPPNLQPIIDQL